GLYRPVTTYRMSYLKDRTAIPWGALQLQFGSDYPTTAQGRRNFKKAFLHALAKVDTSGNLLLRGAHGPIGFGFDIAVGLKGLFPLRPWPFEGGFAPVPPSWGHVEAILSSQHHRFML